MHCAESCRRDWSRQSVSRPLHLPWAVGAHPLGAKDPGNGRSARLGCDRLQLGRAQQADERAAVDTRQAALAQLRPGAGEAGDLGGEARLVADQEHVAAAGGEAEGVEVAAAQLCRGLDSEAEGLTGEARRLCGAYLGT